MKREAAACSARSSEGASGSSSTWSTRSLQRGISGERGLEFRGGACFLRNGRSVALEFVAHRRQQRNADHFAGLACGRICMRPGSPANRDRARAPGARCFRRSVQENVGRCALQLFLDLAQRAASAPRASSRAIVPVSADVDVLPAKNFHQDIAQIAGDAVAKRAATTSCTDILCEPVRTKRGGALFQEKFLQRRELVQDRLLDRRPAAFRGNLRAARRCEERAADSYAQAHHNLRFFRANARRVLPPRAENVFKASAAAI